jgi:hypothetical protein
MRPRLPNEIEKQIPPHLLHLIYSFVPPNPTNTKPSPALQRELKKIQSLELKGKHGMYMKGLDDFLLDTA